MPVLILKHTGYSVLAAVLIWAGAASAATNSYSLDYRPGPADNPLKGFLPYAGNYTTFPHSMEWGYLPLRSLMTGPTNFDWAPLDNMLDGIAQRGHQTVFRIYLDDPSKPTGIPQYLLDAGLVTRTYADHGNANLSVSPDYENPLLRQALTNFIAALGARYNGDPRVGFITVGLLGFWGEWHTYPYDSWFAPVSVQNEVLTAYERAFTRTRRWCANPQARTRRPRGPAPRVAVRLPGRGVATRPRARALRDPRRRGSVRGGLRRVLGLRHRVRAGHLVVFGPLDVPWADMRAHVEALLAETQAAAISIVPAAPASAAALLSQLVRELSHNEPYDLALARAFPRESSLHVMDLRLVDAAALTSVAMDLVRRLRRLPHDVPLALPPGTAGRIARGAPSGPWDLATRILPLILAIKVCTQGKTFGASFPEPGTSHSWQRSGEASRKL